MSNFRDKLHETPEYQATAGQQAQQQAQQQASQAETVTQAAGPVLQLEKGDLQFWTQVATMILLFLIWRELARQNGAAVEQMARGGVA